MNNSLGSNSNGTTPAFCPEPGLIATVLVLCLVEAAEIVELVLAEDVLATTKSMK
jgi:hypothetical protein